MVSYQDAMRTVLEALAAESGCRAESFDATGAHLFERPSERGERPASARRYPPHEPAFAALSSGHGTVVSASQKLLPAVEPLFHVVDRDQAFEAGRLAAVHALLRPFSLQIAGPFPRLICGEDTLRERRPPDGCQITIEVWPSAERLRAFGPLAWPHAIATGPARADAATAAVAIAAYDGDRVAGVAAMSAEAEQLWQIGIDVAESFRGRGIGAALTSALARHALEAKKVPWYGVAPANLASLSTALAAGFRLAWLEVFTRALG